jgi:hypothetical protein
VFFELGIAYERSKPIIFFLTQDDPKDAPVDTRQFEFIRYELGKHEDFLGKLDNAVRNVLGSSLDIPHLYELARELLKQFNLESRFTHDQASREEFHARVVRAAETQGVPNVGDRLRLDPFLLPKILQDATDLSIMKRITVWIEKRESQGPSER